MMCHASCHRAGQVRVERARVYPRNGGRSSGSYCRCCAASASKAQGLYATTNYVTTATTTGRLSVGQERGDGQRGEMTQMRLPEKPPKP